MLRALIVAMLLATAPVIIAAPATATHSCVDDIPCYPHVNPPGPDSTHPKDIILWLGDTARCLVLVQPPTACL